VNFAGPHNPVDITRRMERSARNRKFPQPVDSDQYTPFRHNTIRENYAAMVENIDRLCGLILEEVRRRGESAQTLVVFSSDHGEMLGDHELWGKGVPYQQSVGVPLAVSGPGVARGVVSDALVSLIDVTATLADFAASIAFRRAQARARRGAVQPGDVEDGFRWALQADPRIRSAACAAPCKDARGQRRTAAAAVRSEAGSRREYQSGAAGAATGGAAEQASAVNEK
jgi:arylsulfatase A-like enzyme